MTRLALLALLAPSLAWGEVVPGRALRLTDMAHGIAYTDSDSIIRFVAGHDSIFISLWMASDPRLPFYRELRETP